MSAAWAEDVDLSVVVYEEDFSILDTFNFDLAFLIWGDRGEGGEVFQSVFLRHCGNGSLSRK